LSEYVGQLQRQIEQLGYVLDPEANRSTLFPYLEQRNLNQPGKEIEHKILYRLGKSSQTAKISVRTPIDALGLLTRYSDELSVAIKDSDKTGDPSGFDIIILIDSSSQGITPIGATRQQWNNSKREVQREMKREKIHEISDSIQYLTKNHNMTEKDIRREVPELSTQTQRIPESDITQSSSAIDQIKNRITSSPLIIIILLVIVLGAMFILLYQFTSLGLLDLIRDLI